MFKVIETDEEFEAALAAGLLWLDVSVELPRMNDWRPAHEVNADYSFIRRRWEGRFDSPGAGDKYQPGDFAVLVEDD